jgi:CDP-diacylglycerol--glycerol-3-phosphate 3-phosphatidyltransferase
MAGKVKLPVTLLAKWKTVLQMVALGALQLTLLWDEFGLVPADGIIPVWQPAFETFAIVLTWIAAAVTLWTGWQYFTKAQQKMRQL